MKNIAFIITIIFNYTLTGQSIPTIGSNTTLEIANWNIKWFGDSANGPSNRSLQLKNVTDVIASADIDIWGLAEVSNQKYWDSLLLKNPNYQGVISTWSQTQKTALLFKKSMFSLIYQKHILSVYSYAFAGGRLPLEVALKYTHNARIDTLYFLVVHMKANLGTPTERQTAYDNRTLASLGLKAYLDTAATKKKYFIIGDWNDDLDKSTFNDLVTPYANFLADSVRYFYPSKRITDIGGQSMTSYKEVIDHQCLSSKAKYYYLANSAAAFDLKSAIGSYASTTSDHYPVYSFYDFTRVESVAKYATNVSDYLFYDGNKIRISKGYVHQIALYNPSGQLLYNGKNPEDYIPKSPGIIIVRASIDDALFSGKIIVY